jgi:hypothetical protein
MARMGRPSLRTDRLERYVEWFRRHLVGEEDEREAELGRAHAAAGEAPTVGRHAGPVG